MKWGTKQLTAQINKIKIYATTPTNSTEEEGQPLIIKQECKDVSVSSKSSRMWFRELSGEREDEGYKGNTQTF